MSHTTSTSAGIAKPHKHDVLLGRGGASNHHHGNAVFRSVVSKTRPMYRQVPKHQKIIVARSIVHAVSRQDPPGRFLERRGGAKKGGGGKKGETNLWYEVPFERAVEKAKQALRERGRDEDGSDDDDEGGIGGNNGRGAAVGNGPAAAATGAGTAFGRPAAGINTSRTQLSTADEAVAARYRNMLQFGVAPSVVRSKMDSERIAPHIVQSVLSGGAGGGAQPQQQQPQPQRHVQFASGTNTPTHGSGHGHGSFSIVPAKRRVSSVLLSMFGFGEDDGADGGNGNGDGSGASKPRGLPQEVLDVLEEIVPEGDGHTGPAAAAVAAASAASGAASGAATSPPLQGVGGGGNGGPTASSQRRRSSIFNLFRRKSRSVGGGTLTFEQRSCTSIRYDSESHRKLLVELQADGVDVDGDGDGGQDGKQGATAGGTAATSTSSSAAKTTLADRRSILAEKGQQRKRKASSMAATSPGKSRASLSIVRQQQQIAQQQQQQQKSRPTSIAEAAALVAAETELEEMEPEDVHAQPKRISFSPALFGNLFGSFSAGNVDGAGNPVEAPGTTTMSQAAAQAAAASSAGGHPAEASSPGLLRQSTSAARRSLVATMNLFQQATGKEDPLADTNRSEGSYADGEGGASEPNAKRRRRSTWLSGLRFSTMPAAVESATSAVAAAQAVQGMDLVKDDDDDDDDSIAQKPAAVDDGL